MPKKSSSRIHASTEHHLRFSASAAVPEPYATENGKIRKIRSVTDIDWGRPLGSVYGKQVPVRDADIASPLW